jgi:quercetin dioxygenase-like cupin family protein
MITAYHLYTGSDGNSHVRKGSIAEGFLIDAVSIEFKESPPHFSYDWHNAPIPQYVLSLSGILEFTMASGETFTVHPGEVLLAVDITGTGHKWRLVDDAPWKRAYIIFKPGADTCFVPVAAQ